MNQVQISVHGIFCGLLEYYEEEASYHFTYADNYQGPPLSLSLPLSQTRTVFTSFPVFFAELLPQDLLPLMGHQSLSSKKENPLELLVLKGQDMMGSITIGQIKEKK